MITPQDEVDENWKYKETNWNHNNTIMELINKLHAERNWMGMAEKQIAYAQEGLW